MGSGVVAEPIPFRVYFESEHPWDSVFKRLLQCGQCLSVVLQGNIDKSDIKPSGATFFQWSLGAMICESESWAA